MVSSLVEGCGVIFVVFMVVGFMGYVLPWGQISLWGATVITNLLSVFPYIGVSLVAVLWSDYLVANHLYICSTGLTSSFLLFVCWWLCYIYCCYMLMGLPLL